MSKHLTEDQQIKRILDECLLRDIKFLGFAGEYENVHTRLKLKCLKDGNVWDSCRIYNFFTGRGCPKCSATANSVRRTQPDEAVTKDFMATGAFIEGTHFWKLHINGRNSRYGYYCPVCSTDEYVQHGLCSGVFTASRPNLLAGKLSCRCGSHYKYTPPQWEYRVNKIIEEGNFPYKFLGWEGEWSWHKTKISMYCEEHGESFFPSINAFVHMGSRCPSCATYGFNPDKDASVYILNVEGVGGAFIGYGITGDVHGRLRNHRTNLSREGFSITEHQVFSVSGHDAIRIERAIKENFARNPQVIEGFKTEATHAHLYGDVVDFVKFHATL